MRATTSPIAYKYPIFGTLIVIMTSISLRMFKEIERIVQAVPSATLSVFAVVNELIATSRLS